MAAKTMPDDLKALYNFLSLYARGSHNAKSQKQIAEHFKTYPRAIRAMISTLVSDYRKPVCTTAGDGCYIPTSRSDAEKGIASLKSRENEIRQRRLALEEAIDNAFGRPSLFDLPIAETLALGLMFAGILTFFSAIALEVR